MPICWLDGRIIDEAEASVPIRDAGFLHGAGVFTTMRAAGGRVFRLRQHLERLRDSCDALYVPLPHKQDVLTGAVNRLLTDNGLSDARLRLTVTRGVGGIDPLHGPRHEPTVLLTAGPVGAGPVGAYPSEFYDTGMTVLLLDRWKLNPYDIQAGHKTLDYFSRFAALREASRRGAGEALWFNTHNYLQSASVANVFLVEPGRLITPPAATDLHDTDLRQKTPYARSNVLPGVTRGWVIDTAADLGLTVERSAVPVDRLLTASEVFLTNSVMGVMPVTRIEAKPVGEGRPGEITRQLSDRFAAAIDATS